MYKAFVYEYDSRGNILSRKTYEYTTGTLATLLDTENYYYTNDLLISCDSHYRIYDALGNHLLYEKTLNGALKTFSFTWEKGRQLASVTMEECSYYLQPRYYNPVLVGLLMQMVMFRQERYCLVTICMLIAIIILLCMLIIPESHL